MDSLGDRIKGYEKVSKHRLVKGVPVMIRVDGRAFHTFTKGFDKPFDEKLMIAMVDAAGYVASNMQGFKFGYVQSDEATFVLTDYDRIETQGWFNYNHSKIVSLSAALMTAHFNLDMYDSIGSKIPIFDSRAFNIPREDVVNGILWRMKDWERNSIQMYAQSLFSHKELQGKSKSDIHEMLHKIGKNWTTDLTPRQRNGTLLIKDERDFLELCCVKPNYKELNEIIGDLI